LGSVVEVVQLVVESVAVHNVVDPEVNVTVPVAPPGRPLSAKLEAVPNGTLEGVALALNDVAAAVTVRLVVAVEPA
jgi:hypothetical protein